MSKNGADYLTVTLLVPLLPGVKGGHGYLPMGAELNDRAGSIGIGIKYGENEGQRIWSEGY